MIVRWGGAPLAFGTAQCQHVAAKEDARAELEVHLLR